MELLFDGKAVRATEPEDVGTLSNGFFGKMKGGELLLSPEEALYLVDMRNAVCRNARGKALPFNFLAKKFQGKSPRLLPRYLTYKDWRERGLVLVDASTLLGRYPGKSVQEYKGGSPPEVKGKMGGVFFPESLMCTVDDSAKGKEIYEKWWFGQYGSYKAAHRGKISKLDVFETLYLSKKGNLRLENSTLKKVGEAASSRMKYFDEICGVYEDWRENGFVVKTGFKFGTHFRIYFPGAAPGRGEKGWTHSKHVLHVFPRRSRMLTSEWARAIRLAHSVRKTFILAIPGKKTAKKRGADFALYHRKGGEACNPKNSDPRYLMLSLSEDEYLGGIELSAALVECGERGLELVVAIADRETSVTYYLIKRIRLPHSRYEYFEIEWLNP